MPPRRGRVFSRLSPAQQAEAIEAQQKGPPGPWATHAIGRLLERMPKDHLAGPVAEPARQQRALSPTGGSQGNAGLIRGAPSAGSRYTGGRHYGAQECLPGRQQEDEVTGRTGAPRTGPAFHGGGTIIYDRHVMAKVGSERQQAHPDSTGGQGLSPLADGPVRPVYALVNRVMAPRYGNTSTRHLDNEGPFASTADSYGRVQPLGIQDGSPWSKKYGGTPGLTHLYGVRGTTGVVSPVEPGEPGDGPQKVRGGMPHGLHSHAQESAATRTRRAAATPQQRRTRRSLPANAARAGQSWNQNVQHLGAGARPAPKVAGRLPGVVGRRFGRG